MPQLKISLIIPAYNEEKYIGSCLEYALKNGSGDIYEIIVVDNNSSDSTQKIAKTYPGVKVISEKQKGPTFARQRGYKESTGDILAFIDADTHMPKGWTKQIIEQFSRDNTLGVLTGPYVFYDLPGYSLLYSWIYYPVLLTYCMAVLFGGICVGGNFAIRKSVLDKMNGFDTRILFYGDDTDIARRAKLYAKVKYMLHFKMPTSSRRYKHQGILSTGYQYVVTYIRTNFFHKPAPTEYQDFR